MKRWEEQINVYKQAALFQSSLPYDRSGRATAANLHYNLKAPGKMEIIYLTSQ